MKILILYLSQNVSHSMCPSFNHLSGWICRYPNPSGMDFCSVFHQFHETKISLNPCMCFTDFELKANCWVQPWKISSSDLRWNVQGQLCYAGYPAITQLNHMVINKKLDDLCIIKANKLQCNSMQGKKVHHHPGCRCVTPWFSGKYFHFVI